MMPDIDGFRAIAELRADPSLADVREFVERAFRPIADEKKLAFSAELAGDLPESVLTDAQRLKQVLKNLIANAFKFTDAGTVELRVHRPSPGTVFRESGLRGTAQVVAFSVRDTGIGIPSDQQALIFEAFQQADGSTSRRYGGTGLGLSISREMARLLGGEIHVDSAPGRGSTFTLYLPQILPAPPAPAPEPEDAPPAAEERASHGRNGATKRRGRAGQPALAGKRVLVVDDDARNVFALTSLLRSHGAEVSHAAGGRQALERLRTDPFVDAVLLDIMMPDIDGFRAIAELRADPSLADVPVVAVTAKALPGDRERCLAAGAAEYLAKPVDEDALLATLLGLPRR
ncbi:MAG TPA: ATP-binding protein [Anaeromyxobacter sp.]|nr:ATP-binding protein [Anaeromyxobacter sp.]